MQIESVCGLVTIAESACKNKFHAFVDQVEAPHTFQRIMSTGCGTERRSSRRYSRGQNEINSLESISEALENNPPYVYFKRNRHFCVPGTPNRLLTFVVPTEQDGAFKPTIGIKCTCTRLKVMCMGMSSPCERDTMAPFKSAASLEEKFSRIVLLNTRTSSSISTAPAFVSTLDSTCRAADPRPGMPKKPVQKMTT